MGRIALIVLAVALLVGSAAAFTRSERLRKAVDRAYLAKFRTPWAAKLARAFKTEKRRATTTELRPL